MKVKLLKKLRKRFAIHKEYCSKAKRYEYTLRDMDTHCDYNHDYDLIKTSLNLQELRELQRESILHIARTFHSKRIKIN